MTAAVRPRAGRRPLVVVLSAVLLAALVALGGGIGYLLGDARDRPPADDSVDVGFARDMTVHHGQAVQMAQVARDRSTDPEVRLLAYDIETGQTAQMGQMRGWLQSWGLGERSDRPMMAWMADHTGMSMDGPGMDGARAGGAPMPGMATPAEMTRLRSLSDRALDVFFLQLMVRHHQGGVPMARDGADRASTDHVRGLAAKIVVAQSAEVTTMERMLRVRGGTPLAAR